MRGGTTGEDLDLAQAGHDLLNLLTVIGSYTSLVQRQVEDPTLGRFLAEVQSAVAKSTDLAHRLEAVGNARG